MQGVNGAHVYDDCIKGVGVKRQQPDRAGDFVVFFVEFVKELQVQHAVQGIKPNLSTQDVQKQVQELQAGRIVVGRDWFEREHGAHAGGQPHVDVVKNGFNFGEVHGFGIQFLLLGEVVIRAGAVQPDGIKREQHVVHDGIIM